LILPPFRRRLVRAPGSGEQFDNHFDLDGDMAGELVDADSRAGVAAAVAEDLDQEFGGVVHGEWLVAEARGAGDEAEDLDDASRAVEAAGGGAPLVDRQLRADLALVGELAVALGPMPAV
jgi:hypothetical protein